MSRNTNSRFASNPTNLDISRSTFNRSSSLKTSFNVGEIIPIYVDEVLPGDTHQIKTSKVVRLQTLIAPIMDNIYFDMYYFFVPNRLVWEHWQNFNGENTESAWIPSVDYTVPQITAPPLIPPDGEDPGHPGGWDVGTIADYFGLPTGVTGYSVSALPFRAYALIVNDWFRDQNLQDPLNIPVNDTNVIGSNGSTFITDVVLGGKPYTAAKYHDYFTSCLPAPQKGPDVTLGLSGDLPVYGTGKTLGMYTMNAGTPTLVGTGVPNASPYAFSAQLTQYGAAVGDEIDGGVVPANKLYGVPTKELAGSDPSKTGLVADMSGATMATINAIRMAFQIQKLYEKDARGGTRYIEILKAHFGVTSPDSRLQRPEYLGGNRVPININQVVQSSETSNTPQGNVAGYSLTTDFHNDFTRSFTEHGYIIGLAVARYDHSYQQGIERHWSRKDRFDYYWPVLANIGEQSVLNKEIYVQGSAADNETFGYQEAWADYRYKPSRVTGEMRSQYAQSLDVWHLADDYDSLPYLSDAWIREDHNTVDRVLAVSSDVANQLFGDFYIQNRTTRPMPMYSIPGLIDHH